MACKLFDINTLKKYKFVVVLSRYEEGILLSRHRKRDTWETQGGHIERGESPLEAAKRELYEESGAVDFTLEPLCDYYVGDDVSGAGGMVFTADIKTLGPLPESEMAEVRRFDVLPARLTYEAITPLLFARIGRYRYKRATPADIDTLVETRLIVLRAANKLAADTPLPQVKSASRAYYADALAHGKHAAYLAYDGTKFIGAGGVSFYQILPTVSNPSGERAYIMNMYTDPDYRRRGIAKTMLDLLRREAEARGIYRLSLEATDAGKPLYEVYGFTSLPDEMEMKLK